MIFEEKTKDFEIREESLVGSGDDSELVFMFPGQGSIKPKEYMQLLHKPIVREALRKADEVALDEGLPAISALIQGDAVGNLSSVKPNRDTALGLNLFQYSIQAALFEYLKDQYLTPDVLVAHSFGEFGMLHAAGVLSFGEAFKVVKLREQVSPAPYDLGGLLVVSASATEIEKLDLPAFCTIANLNSPKQTVVAVPQKKIKQMLRFFRTRRVASKELSSVGRPYHSSLMAEAAEKFEIGLRDLKLSPQKVKHRFISSVTNSLYEEGYLFTKDELIALCVNQFLKPVCFSENIDSLLANRPLGFVELGSRPVLTGFVKTIIGQESKVPVKTVLQLLDQNSREDEYNEEVFKIKNGRIFSKVVEFVATVTGYSLDEIEINQKFEDDLRIDSIKKAEILFRSLEFADLESESGLELSKIKYVGNLVDYIHDRKNRGEKKTTLERTSRFGLYKKSWEQAEEPFLIGSKNKSFKLVNAVELKKDWENLEEEIVVLQLSEKFDEGSLLDLTHQYALFLRMRKESGQDLTVILNSESETPEFMALRAFAISLSQEEDFGCVKTVISSLALDPQKLYKEGFSKTSHDILHKNDLRYVKKLIENQVSSVKLAEKPFVLCIGGSKGILAEYLSNTEQFSSSELFFVGRSKADADHVKAAIEKYKKVFSSVRYESVDITSLEGVRELVANLKSVAKKVDLIIDASGSEVSKKYFDKDTSEVSKEFYTKTSGLKNLLSEVSGVLGEAPYLQFNSISSSYGNEGQTVYAMGDSWSVADKRASHLVWPALDRVGMTENLGVLQKLKNQGVDLFPKEEIVRYVDFAISEVESGKSETFDILSLKDHFLLNSKRLKDKSVVKAIGSIDLTTGFQVKNIMDISRSKFLKDHIIGGQCIAPGCYGFASMYLFSKMYFQRNPKVLDFKLQNLIPLEGGPVGTYMKSEKLEQNLIDLKISSRIDNYSGRFVNEEHMSSKLLNDNLDIKYDLIMNDFYSENYSLHGPSFQVLDKIQLTSDETVISKFNVSESQMTGFEEFDFYAHLFESVAQTAGVLVTWKDLVSVVPIGVAEINTHNASITPTLYLKTSDLVKEKDINIWSTDVEVYNDQKELCFTFKGVSGMSVDEHESFPVKFSDVSSRADQWITM